MDILNCDRVKSTNEIVRIPCSCPHIAVLNEDSSFLKRLGALDLKKVPEITWSAAGVRLFALIGGVNRHIGSVDLPQLVFPRISPNHIQGTVGCREINVDLSEIRGKRQPRCGTWPIHEQLEVSNGKACVCNYAQQHPCSGRQPVLQAHRLICSLAELRFRSK